MSGKSSLLVFLLVLSFDSDVAGVRPVDEDRRDGVAAAGRKRRSLTVVDAHATVKRVKEHGNGISPRRDVGAAQ